MNQNTDYTPVALYARVSSDRQDVDLSIAAQLRALRDYAAKNGYIVAREYVDEAAKGSTPSPSSPCLGARASASSPSPSTPTTLPPAS